MATPVAFSALYPLVRQHVKRCPQLGLDVAIRSAARRFCVLTRYRRESVPVDIETSVIWYQLTPSSSDEEVFTTAAAQLNNSTGSLPNPLTPVTPEEAAEGSLASQYQYYYEPPNWINLLYPPTADQAAGLYVRCILQPTRTSTTLDETLVQQHDRTIANGAIAFLLNLNKTSWSNPALARIFDEKFLGDEGVGKGCMDAQMAYEPFNQLTAVYRF